MKYYELTYLISPDLSNEELQALIQKTSGFIMEEQGIIKETSEPLRKRLGSPIKGKSEAFLVTSNFYLNPEKLNNIEKNLKSEKAVLRHIILIKKESSLLKIRKRPDQAPKAETKQSEKKVELKEIDKKIEEILSE